MLSDKLLTEYSYIVSSRFEAINSHYIKLMGEQIREIGLLSPSNLHRLEQMSKMGQNIDEINKLLAAESNRTVADLHKIYTASGISVYQNASKYYVANGVKQVPFAENKVIQEYLKALDKRTRGTFENISRTSAIDKDYRECVDVAIDAVANGVADYNSFIKMQCGGLLDKGIMIEYASGVTRRLDSAIRMNVLEGVRQMNNAVRMQAGAEFGADGVEISAHALCAMDHIDVQGQQYALGSRDVTIDGVTYESFDKLNGMLDRPISTMNCRHIIFPIVLGISEPAYTDEELDAYKQNSENKYDINLGLNRKGNPIVKSFSRYEATQLMRKLETAMRYSKDSYISAEARGVQAEMEEANLQLMELQDKYKKIYEATELEPRWERAYVPGYNGSKQAIPKGIKLSL